MSGRDLRADTWERIAHLFERALERPAGERQTFIEHEAAGDATLAAEVESLLAAHHRAEHFIEQPAADARVLDAMARAAACVGQRIGPYMLRRVLGEGGMGVVYLAEDTRLARLVALKAVAPAVAARAGQRERLAREARAAAALSHPGIATVYALEEIDGHLYMASEYIPGRTLREELGEGAFGAWRAHAAVLQLAGALAVAHAAGIVHRDIKPENIVRAADGTLKILDFGLARLTGAQPTDGNITREGAVLGTPAYMAPEQIRGGTIDERTDVFALGAMAFELTTGVNPFAAGEPAATFARVLEHEPHGFSRDADTGDPFTQEFEQVVLTCLRKAADDRFQSTRSLIEALEAVGGNTAGRPHLPARHQGTRTGRWWWRFHQVVATTAHVALLLPLWHARDLASPERGRLLFLGGVLSVALSGALRLHLLFAARHYTDAWHSQYRRSVWGIRGADLAFAAILLTAGVLALRAAAPAILLVAAAASVAVASAIVEPATTRQSWGDRAS